MIKTTDLLQNYDPPSENCSCYILLNFVYFVISFNYLHAHGSNTKK